MIPQTQRSVTLLVRLGTVFVHILIAVACAGQSAEMRPPPTATVPAPTSAFPPTATPEPQPPEAALNSAACPFDPLEGYSVSCGTVTIPIDHENTTAGTITLFVAIAHLPEMRVADRLSDPLIYLDGGPGSYTIANAPFIFESLGKVAGVRDLVIFDQRGVGLSEPELDCPEQEEALRTYFTSSTTPQEQNAAWLQAINSCHDRLLGTGIEPALFTVTQSAHDVAALRAILGYQQLNLLGISYGTRLAQAVLALPDADQWVRSAILDSTLAPDFATVTGNVSALKRALVSVSANCAADPQCLARYGDVTDLFAQSMQRLNDDPLTVNVFDPITQQPLEIVVDGYRFRDVIFNMLYRRQGVAYVPLAIERTGRGFGDALHDTLQISLVLGAYSSEGMNATTACSFQIPESEAAVAGYNAQASPAFAIQEDHNWWLEGVCDIYGITPNPQVGALINSPIPVLVLAGEYDPATPPDGARRVAAALGNATYVELSGAAHGVLNAGGTVSKCALPIAAAFIADPTAEPDLTCVAEVKPLGFIVR